MGSDACYNTIWHRSGGRQGRTQLRQPANTQADAAQIDLRGVRLCAVLLPAELPWAAVAGTLSRAGRVQQA